MHRPYRGKQKARNPYEKKGDSRHKTHEKKEILAKSKTANLKENLKDNKYAHQKYLKKCAKETKNIPKIERRESVLNLPSPSRAVLPKRGAARANDNRSLSAQIIQ